ncbi:class I SAM-dependent methyltransferase [Streptomyces sp. DG2A-72]|uniref:class I SAM-dependent methyltransferase n=1 Tax=Streptomyces sp. DG2A-72 TaxID=3051386 RepID=UPI00265C4C15|nr:class I SAM-dependent methyltransferase [Streptomyces sp. DG2A-72]MDO0937731.1 class I SAM-dependent methyltransferase [Streptomyces sp. DG2A-72]
MGVSMATAKLWVERWELQQEHYATDREERFTVIADAVEHVTADRAHPLILDLGCGPGSLAARLAARLPRAEIVAVDMDPLLLELGRTHHANAARYVDTVIGDDGWTDALGLDRPLDAAVSTTALHYLPEPVLLRTYQHIAALLRPGGALINGDHFTQADPCCAALTAHVGNSRARRSHTCRHEDWTSWWNAAAQDAELADLVTRREQRQSELRNVGGSDNGLTLTHHIELLRQAGFPHVTPVWQFGDSHVLAALKN